jgi:hypothetical protein
MQKSSNKRFRLEKSIHCNEWKKEWIKIIKSSQWVENLQLKEGLEFIVLIQD